MKRDPRNIEPARRAQSGSPGDQYKDQQKHTDQIKRIRCIVEHPVINTTQEEHDHDRKESATQLIIENLSGHTEVFIRSTIKSHEPDGHDEQCRNPDRTRLGRKPHGNP